jgi:hypothetical protein
MIYYNLVKSISYSRQVAGTWIVRLSEYMFHHSNPCWILMRNLALCRLNIFCPISTNFQNYPLKSVKQDISSKASLFENSIFLEGSKYHNMWPFNLFWSRGTMATLRIWGLQGTRKATTCVQIFTDTFIIGRSSEVKLFSHIWPSKEIKASLGM